MGFKRLTELPTDGDLHEQVPWGNVWVKQFKDRKNDPLPIRYCIEYSEGVMAVTDEYKAYLYLGKTDCTDLLEAMEIFVAEGLPEWQLFCQLDKKGKPIILVSDEVKCHKWHKTENRYVQVRPEAITVDKGADKKRKNPLLAGRAVS